MLIVCLLTVQVSLAQNIPSSLSNLRTKNISTKSTQVKLDSLSIFPNTIRVENTQPDQYTVDPVNAVLMWINRPLTDSVKISYRVFPYKLNAVTQHFNFDSIRNNFLLEKPYVFRYGNKQAPGIFDFGNINYNGSFGRGISFRQ